VVEHTFMINPPEIVSKTARVVLIMVSMYIFLVIERPWESVQFLQGIPIERAYAIMMILIAILMGQFRIVKSPINKWVYGLLTL
jgi:hypothetical protein